MSTRLDELGCVGGRGLGGSGSGVGTGRAQADSDVINTTTDKGRGLRRGRIAGHLNPHPRGPTSHNAVHAQDALQAPGGL